MPISVFTDKYNVPTEQELEAVLGERYSLWTTIRLAALNTGIIEKESWHFSGQKYGWGYRISDKKRVIIYLLPREGYFKVAFVFGEKAVDAIKESTIDSIIIKELVAAKKYAEGKGIWIDVKDHNVVKDVLMLVNFKISN